MPRRLHALLSSILGVVVVIAVYGYKTHAFALPHAPSDTAASVTVQPSTPVPEVVASSTVKTNALVIRAVDGDTLLVQLDGEVDPSRVRLLGINTPETVDPRKPVECFGKEASAHMHALVDGRRVRLVADSQADERDVYGRLLRNLMLADGTDENAAMVQDGYAYAYLSFPLNPQRKKQLKKLQEDAKLSRRGLWSSQACHGLK